MGVILEFDKKTESQKDKKIERQKDKDQYEFNSVICNCDFEIFRCFDSC